MCDTRDRYERIIADMDDEKLINALIVLGSKCSDEYELVTVRSDLCDELARRYPETNHLMESWLADDDRVGSYAHALVASVIAWKGMGE